MSPLLWSLTLWLGGILLAAGAWHLMLNAIDPRPVRRSPAASHARTQGAGGVEVLAASSRGPASGPPPACEAAAGTPTATPGAEEGPAPL